MAIRASFAQRAQRRHLSRKLRLYRPDVYGFADMHAQNTATGIIVTGDDSAGILIRTNDGSGTALNEGAITTGDGVVKQYTCSGDYRPPVHRPMACRWSPWAIPMGQKATAINSGDITVGDLAIGVSVGGYSALGGDYARSGHGGNRQQRRRHGRQQFDRPDRQGQCCFRHQCRRGHHRRQGSQRVQPVPTSMSSIVRPHGPRHLCGRILQRPGPE